MLIASPDMAVKRSAAKCRAMNTVQARKAGAQPMPISACPSTSAPKPGAKAHSAAPPTAIGNAHRTVRRTPYRSSESPMVICSRPKPRWKALDHRPSCRALSP